MRIKKMEITILKKFLEFTQKLQSIYDSQEAESIALLVFAHYLNLDRLKIQLNRDSILEDEKQQLLETVLERLLSHEPVQYILGETEFYGLKFKVNPSVLIPRRETEELLDLIIKENQNSGLKILDICTGSGCIPIALQKNLENAELIGIDISEEALKTAKENAEINNSEVKFLQADALNIFELPGEKFDIIISNPPYVTVSEKVLMNQNVLNYEPHLALFVEDSDPLIFYKKIIEYAKDHLSEKGKIYFEINETYGDEIQKNLLDEEFKEVRVLKDMQGRERMVVGMK